MPRRMSVLLQLKSLCALALLSTLAAAAEDSTRLGLEQFWRLAEEKGAQLDESKGKIEFAEARSRYASSQALVQGKLDLLVGPAPGATGDALVGRNDWGSWSVFTGVKAELVQPIYSFGALGAAREAAEAGIRAEQGLMERARWALRVEVAELYYGYQLAFELSEVASGIHEKLEQALKEGTRLREERRKGAPTETDLDKLRVYLSEVKVREAEAEKGRSLARAGMSWKIGTYGQSEPKWDKANLVFEPASLKTLSDYHAMATEKRAELKALREDVIAKEALVRVERGQLYPAIFLAGQVSGSRTPNRVDQQSPFANDPLNDLSAGIALGLRWNLDFFSRSAKLSMARAEAVQAEARERHLGRAILAEVEKNYRDLNFALDAVPLREEGSKAAKRVMQDAFVAFTLGTGSAKDLLEAIGSLGLSEKSRYEAVFAANTGRVRLSQSIGEWIK